MKNDKHRLFSFPLYASDFLVSTGLMSAAEVGAYMRLLCHSWLDDGLPNDPKLLSKMSGISAKKLSKVLEKFYEENGKLRQHRQEEVRTQVVKLSATRRNAANSRWAKNGENDANASISNASGVQLAMLSKQSKTNQSKTNQNNPSPTPPTRGEVEAFAGANGVDGEFAARWWGELDSVGWVDVHGREIVKWTGALITAHTRWRAYSHNKAQGGNAGPVGGVGGAEGAKRGGEGTWHLTERLKAIKEEIERILSRGYEKPFVGWVARDEEDRAKLKELKKTRQATRDALAGL